jgi:hypothetical protein
MGWNYRFVIDLNAQGQSVVSQFAQLVTHMSGDTIFGNLVGLNVYSFQKYYDERIAGYRDAQVEHWLIRDTPDVTRGLELVQQLPTKYPTQGYLFEALWQVKRLDWARHSGTPIDDFVVSLYTFSKGFPAYPGSNLDYTPGIAYEVRDAKYYRPSVQEMIGTKNMEALITELSFFANYGVASIYGLDNETDSNPLTHKLCYHHIPLGFLDDLRRAYPEKAYPQTITEKTIKRVASECDKVWLRQVSTGLMIVNSWGTIGSIKGFYEALSHAVEVK